MTSIKAVERKSYNIGGGPAPGLHQELAWWATDDDKVLGSLILDKADGDFSYIVMIMDDETKLFICADVGVSRPTADDATRNLHAAMLEMHKQIAA